MDRSAGLSIVRVGGLVDNSGINHVTQQRAVSQTLRWRLHHKHHKHLLFRIDPKGRSARAIPIVFPWKRRGAFSKASQISPMAMRSTPAAAPWKCSTRKWKVGASTNSTGNRLCSWRRGETGPHSMSLSGSSHCRPGAASETARTASAYRRFPARVLP